jgi:hypothetical protein
MPGTSVRKELLEAEKEEKEEIEKEIRHYKLLIHFHNLKKNKLIQMQGFLRQWGELVESRETKQWADSYREKSRQQLAVIRKEEEVLRAQKIETREELEQLRKIMADTEIEAKIRAMIAKIAGKEIDFEQWKNKLEILFDAQHKLVQQALTTEALRKLIIYFNEEERILKDELQILKEEKAEVKKEIKETKKLPAEEIMPELRAVMKESKYALFSNSTRFQEQHFPGYIDGAHVVVPVIKVPEFEQYKLSNIEYSIFHGYKAEGAARICREEKSDRAIRYGEYDAEYGYYGFYIFPDSKPDFRGRQAYAAIGIFCPKKYADFLEYCIKNAQDEFITAAAGLIAEKDMDKTTPAGCREYLAKFLINGFKGRKIIPTQEK